ncbi:hypothetical protein L3X38_005324 [Prunus dulcis]|uniref:Retroviral polymerase SH3-like domain-containing protein n=1 Tax=Prunus dulcis TaxID=3755 RepID=A0AAD4ZQI5_PRUDU|nr:hypothetical protein L3X38_005324 [Prunus dulcis]
MFVGYATCEKGYRIYDPISKKLTLSRDIIFDEEKSWNWSEHSNKAVASFINGIQNEPSCDVEDEGENATLSPHTENQQERSPMLSQIYSQNRSSDISSEERNTQDYDHSPLKWRRLDDVLAQCNLCIIEPEKYAEAAQDKSWLKLWKTNYK